MTQEKVIELEEIRKEPIPSKEFRIIEAKPVTKLTEEERNIIYESFKNGKEQPNFSIRELKNGGSKIIKSVNKTPQKTESNIPNFESNKQTFGKFTNEQMLIQSVMDLNSRLDKITSKHKKLKKKYKKMKSDIYVDLNDIEQPVKVPETKPEEIPEKVEENNTPQNVPEEENRPPTEQEILNYFQSLIPQRGWRQGVKYL